MTNYHDVTVVNVGERKFRISAINPEKGLYLVAKLSGVLLPVVQQVFNKDDEEDIDFGKIVASLSKEDLLEIQKECLVLIEEDLPGGYARVRNDDGTYGVNDVSMHLILQLLVKSLEFNFKDFFIEAFAQMSSLLGDLNAPKAE